MNRLGDLSNDELFARLRAHVGKGHVWQARLIAYLAEVDRRRLDLVHACPSMWEFCIERLGMSESEAQRRIAAARLVRRFPRVLGYLERGDVHLCGVYALRKHLTEENHEELLREATGKSISDIQAIIAARFPKPDVPTCIELVAPQMPLTVSAPATQTAQTGQTGQLPTMPLSPAGSPAPRPKVQPLSATRYRVELTISAEIRTKLERIKDLMRHRNPTGDLETILDASFDLLLAELEKERLGKTDRPRRTKAVTNAATPPRSTHEAAAKTRGDDEQATSSAAAGGERSVSSLSEVASTKAGEHAETPTTAGSGRSVSSSSDVPRTKSDEQAKPSAMAGGRRSFSSSSDVPRTKGAEHEETPAATNAERPVTPASKKAARRRRESMQTRREVFARDGEQCTYVGPDGTRCSARGHLELDHIHAKALGGSNDAANLRVRCRAHNHHYAEQVFGREYIAERIHLRRGKCEGAPSSSLETAASALRTLGFREPEVRRALATREATLDIGSARMETIIREALRLLT